MTDTVFDSMVSDNEAYVMPSCPTDPSYPPFICPKGKDHCPKNIEKRKDIKGWLYQAAFHGCLPCVQHSIEKLGVDPHIESDSQKYTPLVWAKWAAAKEVDGATEVVKYLTDR